MMRGRAAARRWGAGLLMLGAAGAAQASPAPGIVAAESAYADLARQVAGPGAAVIAILHNPAVDPHFFEPSASAARAVAEARVVIENGIGYDGWMDRLRAASHASGQTAIVVADLLHRHPGDNPHLWYDPAAAPALVQALTAALTTGDPAQAAALQQRSTAVLGSLQALDARIAELRAKYAGTAVAATEPVFGPMLQALGVNDRSGRLERAVMNGTEPRAVDVAALEDALRAHEMRVLIVSAQASSPETVRLTGLARAQDIPVVTISETLPPQKTYQQWLGGELDALQSALEAR